MSYTYSEAFERLARTLGFADDPIKALVHVRDPLHLDNRTLPAVESVMIGGAGLALVRAWQRNREHDDPTTLAVWLGSVAYLAVTETPLYFPDAFHLPESARDVFAHNVFSVQFLYEHLPLYIVALYPAMATLAYEIVQALGGFEGNAVLGAVSAGFVHHVFYEIFDQIGPQLKWWAWNPDSDSVQPMLASVPMTSVSLFATVGPAALALFTRLLVGRKVDRGEPVEGWSLVRRSLAIGALVPLALAVGGTPSSVAGADRRCAQAALLSVPVALSGAVAGPVLARGWRRSRSAATPSAGGDSSWFAVGFGGLYLAAFGALWGRALPDYRAAEKGVTPGGTPTGSLAYTLACAGLAASAVAAVATRSGRTGWRGRLRAARRR